MADRQITPTPTDEEAAAIVAAVDALWPRPSAATGGGDTDRVSRAALWRFSGRWWNRATPAAARRSRRPRL
jgi:hypothetical protein